MFIALLASVFLALPKAPQIPSPLPHPIAQADKSPERFDGRRLYNEAFQTLLDLDLSLQDPATRRAWAARFRQPRSELLTEAATDEAVREMIAALGERYNFYLTPVATKNFSQMVAPKALGFGFSIKIHGADAALSRTLRELGAAANSQAAREEVFRKFLSAVATDDGPVEIAEVFPGSAAEQAGIKAGDKILSVNGTGLNGLNLSQVLQVLGGSGEHVLSLADTSGQTRNVRVAPGPVINPVVHYRSFDDVAYIKLDNFMSEHAGTEMARALNQSRSSRAIVIDLRGNLGGRMDTALNMIQQFLSTGVVTEVREREGDHFQFYRHEVTSEFLVTTQWRDDHGMEARTTAGARAPQLVADNTPVVVLVDANSYSASEMLAGALQANRRAVVVGLPTGGKGVGQLVVPLPYGRTLEVTNFNFLPGGVNIDWIGVVPDTIVVQRPDYVYGYWPSDQQLEVALQVAREQLRQRDQQRNLRALLCRKRHLAFKSNTSESDLVRLCPAP